VRDGGIIDTQNGEERLSLRGVVVCGAGWGMSGGT
jgi:hypothetical protein